MNRPLADAIGPAMRQLIEKRRRESFPSAERAEKIPVPVSAEVDDPVLHGTFLVTLTPLVGEEGESTGFVLVAHDVTPHARLEAERADLRNRLVQSEKLAALGQFVAGIAHELNNPLQGVLGHLELLRATGAFPKELRRDMQRIYREADRAAKIVRNLLVFAGSRRLVRKRTSINADAVARACAPGAGLSRLEYRGRPAPRRGSAPRQRRSAPAAAGIAQHCAQRRAGHWRGGRPHRDPHFRALRQRRSMSLSRFATPVPAFRLS